MNNEDPYRNHEAVDQLAWVEVASAQPSRVDFVRDAPSRSIPDSANGRTVASINTLGPLPKDQKVGVSRHLSATYLQTISSWEALCKSPGHGPNGIKTMADLLEEMDMLLMAKRHEAELDALEKDDYLTIPTDSDGANDVVFPNGFLTTIIKSAATLNGNRVDVVFGVGPLDPIIKDYYSEVQMLRQLADQQRVEEFNAQPFAERQQRIQGHLRAVEQLRRRDGSVGESGEAARRAMVNSLMPMFLPGEWILDEVSCFARLK